jgi:hypothetical protein
MNPTKKDIKQALDDIKKLSLICCKHYGITLKEFKSKSQKREFVEPRFVSTYIIRQKYGTKISLSFIGWHVAGRGHSIVCHAMKKVNELYATSRLFRNTFKAIEDEFKNIEIARRPEKEKAVEKTEEPKKEEPKPEKKPPEDPYIKMLEFLQDQNRINKYKILAGKPTKSTKEMKEFDLLKLNIKRDFNYKLIEEKLKEIEMLDRKITNYSNFGGNRIYVQHEKRSSLT